MDTAIYKRFQERKDNPLFNTSYPIRPEDWEAYRTDGELDFAGCNELAFYIHIPFCQHICRFCEYTRIHVPHSQAQQRYLSILAKDIDRFLNSYPHVTLVGFDIGGGTPTSLDENNFRLLLEIYHAAISRVNLSGDYEPSIEATFQTITPHKVRLIKDAGINRVSIGVQSSAGNVQKNAGRVNPDIRHMMESIEMIRRCGIEKINIDLMYGLKGQTLDDIPADLELVRQLSPEQVTLYELRTNINHEMIVTPKEQLYEFYQTLYNGLTSLGYVAHFGQNTFTRYSPDKGLSSYLRHRMLDFMPYKGFGISAQSMSRSGISYNAGKLQTCLSETLNSRSYGAADTYLLPRQEMLSKYIAVSAYYGRFKISLANQILGDSMLHVFAKELDFCLSNGLVYMDDDAVCITPKGFLHYGAVFSLFYRRSRLSMQPHQAATSWNFN